MASPEEERSGRCLCGNVQYVVGGEMDPVFHCHCENCRRLTGNFVAATRVATLELQIDDAHNSFRWYDLDYARYGFCRACGSTMFYQAAEHREITSVMVGTLDDASELPVAQVWFAAEAQRHNENIDQAQRFERNG